MSRQLMTGAEDPALERTESRRYARESNTDVLVRARKRDPREQGCIVIMPTNRCDRKCATCGIGRWVLDAPPEDLSLATLEKFIWASEEAGYRFQAHVSGGEPLLWPYFVEGMRMLKRSKSVQFVEVYSNARYTATKLERFRQALDYIDVFRPTIYPDAREKGMVEFVEAWKGKRTPGVFTSHATREEFFIEPDGPMGKALPAICECPWLTLWPDGYISICPHAPRYVDLLGLSPNWPWRVRVQHRFLDKFGDYRREDQPFCARCMNNSKVACRLTKTVPVPKGH